MVALIFDVDNLVGSGIRRGFIDVDSHVTSQRLICEQFMRAWEV